MSSLSQKDHNRVNELGLIYARGDNNTKIVWLRDSLAIIFKVVLICMRLLPHEVGIHPANRTTEGITAIGIWRRGRKVIAGGFSHTAIGKLWAFEDHPIKRHIVKHTVAKTVGDEFGNLDIGDVKVGQANWTHCNQFVNQVVCRAVCSDPETPCVDGRINSEAIFKDPANVLLHEYAKQGMNYTVFPSWVEEEFPWMPDLFQVAANQEMQVQDGESYMQALLKIIQRTSEVGKGGKSPSADSIAKWVLRSQPRHAQDIPAMVDWNQKFGGGDDGMFVLDLNEYIQAIGTSTSAVRISGRTFAALAKLEFGIELPSHSVLAVLKIMATSIDKVQDEIASSISVMQIGSFQTKHKEKFLQADQIMKNNEVMLDQAGLARRHRVLTAGWCQTSLIDHILERPNMDGTSFESMDKIVAEFIR